MTLKIELLGKPRFIVDDTDVTARLLIKAQALLAYLAVTGETHSRIALAGLLWADVPETKAKNSLRVTLSNLRKLLPDHLTVTHLTLAFNQDSDFILDLDQFKRYLAAQQWRPMSLLYRGNFLDDFYVDGAPDFEEWQMARQAYWKEVAIDALVEAGNQLLVSRDYPAAAEVLQRCLLIEPWHEEAHRQLMISYSRLGEFNRALAQYETCRQLLSEEFGVPPMPETQDTYERIRAARQSRPAVLPPGDLPFVGREEELAEIGRLLLNPECRLISIIGLGGSGKTRLAVEAARRANREQALEFVNGVAFISLADVADGNMLPTLIFEALGMTRAGQRWPEDALLNFLRNKEMLLILDNFEDQQDGGRLLLKVMREASGITLLVTGREPLEIGGEWRIDLSGLPYPSSDTEGRPLEEFAAVQLFLEAARQVKNSFQITADNQEALLRLCAMVEGMPLALRLAAPWLAVAGLPQIVEQIHNSIDILASRMSAVPERQRSLRAIFEYSWQRLAQSEQAVLSRLSIFRGGCTFLAAQTVAGASLEDLSALVNRSLLRFTEKERYVIHGLVRQFAAEKLQELEGEAANIWDKFIAFYADFASQRYTTYLSGGYHEVIDGMLQEHDNIQTAWKYLSGRLSEEEQFSHLIKMVQPLAWFYQRRGRYDEGIALFEETLRQTPFATEANEQPYGQQTIRNARAFIESRLASLYYFRGDYQQSEALLAAALPIFEESGQLDQQAYALNTWSMPTRRRGDYAQAKALANRSLALYREAGHSYGEMQPLNLIAVIAADEGDYALAESTGHQLIDFYSRLNDWPNLARTLSNLANTLIRQNRFQEAKKILEEAYMLAREDNNYFSQIMAGTNLALVARGLGEFSTADQYNRSSLALAREIGNQRWISVNLIAFADNSLAQKRWRTAERYAREALAITHAIDSEQDTLAALSTLAQAWAYQGHVQEAVGILLFVQQQPATVKQDLEKNSRVLDELQAELSENAREMWFEGKSLSEIVEWIEGSKVKSSIE
ncbi:MAG: tetratricopeptide repeat protein [Ardenticatenaceae bacterium]|nr:tetratricopeptide repeat protein [Ardenticatenaceae bacterium]